MYIRVYILMLIYDRTVLHICLQQNFSQMLGNSNHAMFFYSVGQFSCCATLMTGGHDLDHP